MPYTYKKEGDKYVVYKKDGRKKVGSTDGNKEALNKYLAALHMHENNKPQMKYIKTFEDFTNKEVSTDLNEAVINSKADAYLIKKGIAKEKLADFKEAALSFITDEIMDEPGGFAEDIFEFYSTTKLDVLGDYAEDYLENEDESKSEVGKELNEQLINEKGPNSGKGYKNADKFTFDVWPRNKEALRSGAETKHSISVSDDENVNDIKKKILKDYPRNKYFYVLWKKGKGGYEQFETNESIDITEDELNERERLRYVGTYRAKNGKIYKKWKDDENYIAIEVNGTYVTIEGDGEKKTDDEVMKEIEDALKESTVTEGKVNEGANDEGDAKVLSFLKRLAKDWDIPVARAADFVKTSIKRNGY